MKNNKLLYNIVKIASEEQIKKASMKKEANLLKGLVNAGKYAIRNPKAAVKGVAKSLGNDFYTLSHDVAGKHPLFTSTMLLGSVLSNSKVKKLEEENKKLKRNPFSGFLK